MSKMFRYFLWVFCLFSLVLLNGCSTVSTSSDGPPPYDIDVSKIPDAKPKKEALSKYGNIPKYRVLGRSYYTMKSSKNYEENGVASWYGTKFHSKHTSSGEPYNMLGMTAAHKTLPLPTYVQVTNLKNGKKVVVKVNDRGPFEANRIIDLSYVAAKKLGMLGHGTAYVNVKAIDPDEHPYENYFFAQNKKVKQPIETAQQDITFEPKHKSKFYLQVGAFQNRAYAESLRKRLSHVVMSPVHITQLASHHKKLYRVQIGPIKDVVTADSISKQLRAIGLSGTKITTV